VVESRGNRGTLAACGLGRDTAVNVRIMPNTTDPRRFYGLTKIALVPSLCLENQPLVAVESMINGIPVIGSDRGGTPEVLGESGIVLPLPDRLAPLSTIVPEADEVEPWVEAVIRLWDDRELYEKQSALARKEAQRWHPDRLLPLYAEFFRNVRFQPGVPLPCRNAGASDGGTPPARATIVNTNGGPRHERGRDEPIRRPDAHRVSIDVQSRISDSELDSNGRPAGPQERMPGWNNPRREGCVAPRKGAGIR
jgi:hypothetical protein